MEGEKSSELIDVSVDIAEKRRIRLFVDENITNLPRPFGTLP
jgi:hypothetical protein